MSLFLDDVKSEPLAHPYLPGQFYSHSINSIKKSYYNCHMQDPGNNSDSVCRKHDACLYAQCMSHMYVCKHEACRTL